MGSYVGSYRVTVTSSQRAVWHLVELEFSEAQLTEHFTTYEIGEKEGEAVIPAVFTPCPDPCRNAHKPDGKAFKCGGSAQHRLGANVAAMTMIGADLDHLPEARLDQIVASLIARGIKFWIWETYNHAPPDDCRARILVPFLVPLPLRAPAQWSKIAWPALIRFLGLDGAAGADHACRDPARVYYLPRKASEEQERYAAFVDGAPLDWRPIIGDALDRVVDVAPAGPPGPQDLTAPVDLAAVRERLKTVKKEGARALVRNVLAGRPPTPPPDKRAPGQPSRYLAWRTVTGILASVAEDSEASDALLELLRESYSAEVSESPDDHTEWETIEQLFESARANMPAIRAQKQAEREAQEAIFRRALSRALKPARPEARALQSPGMPEPIQGESGPAEVAVTVSVADAEEDEDPAPAPPTEPEAWTREVILIPSKDQVFALKNCGENVDILLSLHPDWAGQLRYNEVSKEVEIHGGPLFDGRVRGVKDSDAVRTARWLAQQFRVHQPTSVIWKCLLACAEAHAYDPLRDYLRGLQWDGVVRLPDWLTTYCSATDGAEYLEAVGTKWMVSAVARALRPGCQVDSLLILEGEQGAGKTSVVRILGGDWFTSEAIDIHSKDGLIIVSKSWLIEFGELESLRKSETTAQKAFLSKTFDEFRAPYGFTSAKHPRRCVFIGSTNTDDYLQDVTGNRRYWPVSCGRIDLDALKRDRDLLWAEAVAYYESGQVEWWLDPEERAHAELETAERMSADAIAEQIEDWFLCKQPGARPPAITTWEICKQVLGDEDKASRGMEMRIGKALRRLGFKRARRAMQGHRGYVMPAAWATLPARQKQSIASQVAQARGMQIVDGNGKGKANE